MYHRLGGTVLEDGGPGSKIKGLEVRECSCLSKLPRED